MLQERMKVIGLHLNRMGFCSHMVSKLDLTGLPSNKSEILREAMNGNQFAIVPLELPLAVHCPRFLIVADTLF